MMGYFSVSKNAAPFRSLSRNPLPVSMLEDLIMAVTEDLVRSASLYIMVPLKSENLPSTSVTPANVTEKPTLEWSASTENFSAAKPHRKSRQAALTAKRNRPMLKPRLGEVFICTPRLLLIHQHRSEERRVGEECRSRWSP